MIPMAVAPDEVTHLWVVKFITEHLRLPNHGDVFSGGLEAVYGPLPQAGYLPHIVISKFLPFWDVAITARLGSLVMGISLVWIAYFLARELYPKNRLAGLALPMAIVFHPQMVFLDAYTNSDATAATASALIFLLVVRMIRRGLNLWQCCGVGILSGLAVLSKYAALSVVAAAVLGLIAAGWLNGASVALTVASIGVTLSALALSCSWWFFRELHEYSGDLLGTKTMRSIWAVATNKPLVFNSGVWSVIVDFRWWRLMYFSFWGLFDNMTQYLPKPIYVTYFAFMLIAIAGGVSRLKELPKLLNMLAIRLRLKENDDFPEENLEILKYGAIYKMFALSIIINLAAMIWSSSLNLGGAQGRYLFANELPIFALTISGLLSLSGKCSKKLLWGFLAFSVFAYVWSFVLLASKYGFHTNPYYYVPLWK
jgi:4-amino-4-deoxy-L-arabinose transferase-like glycosyltransferase